MDFINTLKIIIRDIEEARSILDEVSNNANATEIGLAKARLHSASEMLSLLPRMVHQTETVEAKDHVQAPTQHENKTQEIPPVLRRDKNPEPVIEAETAQNDEPETIIKEVVKETTIQVTELLQNKKEKPQEAASITTQLIFADKFDKDVVLGEQLSGKPDNDISTTLGSKPVEDITVAIGINDRFLFTRELFGGNQEEYYKIVSRLNKATTLDEAINILDKSVAGNPDADAYSSFTDILKRKFPVK